MKNKIIIFIITFIICGFGYHKYYVSTGLYEYRQDLNSLQITIRVFEDDFTNIIKKKYQLDLGLNNLNSVTYKSNIKNYLDNNLNIFIDNQKNEYTYLGIEKKNEMFIIYAEIEDVKMFETIQIQNTILFDSFSDQKNIIHFRNGSQRKSFILTKNESNVLFEL